MVGDDCIYNRQVRIYQALARCRKGLVFEPIGKLNNPGLGMAAMEIVRMCRANEAPVLLQRNAAAVGRQMEAGCDRGHQRRGTTI